MIEFAEKIWYKLKVMNLKATHLPRLSVVYMATNQVNGNRYIGVTCKSMDLRRREHLSYAKNKSSKMVFHAAIRKYGPGNFQWEILATLPNYREALDSEIAYIRELKPEYNATLGGQGIIGMPRDAEWRKKMSEANKGKKPSQLALDRYKDLCAGLHEEKVTCLNDGERYPSFKKAAAFYGVSPKSITEIVAGRQTHASGIFFVRGYVDYCQTKRLLTIDALRRKTARNKTRVGKAKSKPVICINTGLEYPSAYSAAEANGVRKVYVSLLCRNGKATGPNSLRFKYKNDDGKPLVGKAA